MRGHPITCLCDECVGKYQFDTAGYVSLPPRDKAGRWVFVPDGHTVTIEPKRERTDYHREYGRKRRAAAKAATPG